MSIINMKYVIKSLITLTPESYGLVGPMYTASFIVDSLVYEAGDVQPKDSIGIYMLFCVVLTHAVD